MDHHVGDVDMAGDGNVQDQGYSFDVNFLEVDSCSIGSFDSFYSFGPECQPVGFSTSCPGYGFDHLSDSAFSGSFYCNGLSV